ncbi:MAG: hypothetical protein M3298_00025 [Thermoproteota archaeon]|jgi:flagellar basal body-associated protein FliL|nr:hypothetical protein [Thermoproteota archaeon]
MRHIHKNTCSTNNSIARATAAIFLMLAITIVLLGGTAIFAPLTAPLQSAEHKNSSTQRAILQRNENYL